MPYPDNFSSAAYRAAYEAPVMRCEPPLNLATSDDILKMQRYRASLVVSLACLRDNAWDYDSTEIPSHAFLVRDAEVMLEQMDAALAQARREREGWV